MSPRGVGPTGVSGGGVRGGSGGGSAAAGVAAGRAHVAKRVYHYNSSLKTCLFIKKTYTIPFITNLNEYNFKNSTEITLAEWDVSARERADNSPPLLVQL